MNGIEYGAGSIITMEPNEVTDFECLEDGTVNVVVKIPGANNDKYVVEQLYIILFNLMYKKNYYTIKLISYTYHNTKKLLSNLQL